MYRVPPKAPLVDQGSLVRTEAFQSAYDLGLGVVMTPQCDIANKAQFISIAGIAPPAAAFEWLGIGSRGGARREVERLVEGHLKRWYFLHPEAQIEGLDTGAFVDFQLMASFPAEEVRDRDVVGQLEPPWTQDLSFEYVTFMGRIGTEDVSAKRKDWVRALVQLVPRMTE